MAEWIEERVIGTLFLAGQNREMTFLIEQGLYEVLFQSRKPIAKAFGFLLFCLKIKFIQDFKIFYNGINYLSQQPQTFEPK